MSLTVLDYPVIQCNTTDIFSKDRVKFKKRCIISPFPFIEEFVVLYLVITKPKKESENKMCTKLNEESKNTVVSPFINATMNVSIITIPLLIQRISFHIFVVLLTDHILLRNVPRAWNCYFLKSCPITILSEGVTTQQIGGEYPWNAIVRRHFWFCSVFIRWSYEFNFE